ncbi:hypothetical protein JX266_014314 [Neoarthrinium moseri]|nr:hypothetical protein JX266_014314 [Neoarthrinium moseri]
MARRRYACRQWRRVRLSSRKVQDEHGYNAAPAVRHGGWKYWERKRPRRLWQWCLAVGPAAGTEARVRPEQRLGILITWPDAVNPERFPSRHHTVDRRVATTDRVGSYHGPDKMIAPNTSGDRFFKETLRLFHRKTNHHTLTRTQASGSLSLCDASSGRSSESWCYAGRSVRMAIEMSLDQLCDDGDEDETVQGATFWGAFALGHAWSLATGSLPQSSSFSHLSPSNTCHP